tara:strand:- start:318 stop:938 length:621 start_codon:yes stop_codon:yes gene_type:complete
MHQNEFEGPLPDEFYQLTNLEQIYLNSNQFSGTISSQLSGLQSLERLRMHNNNFSGELPEEVCELQLDWDDPSTFNISNNNFCEPYPTCIIGFEGDQDTSSCGEEVSISDDSQPLSLNIARSYPNPFNPYTTIEYTIPYQVKVQMYISDIIGRKVVTLVSGIEYPGSKKIQWDGRNSSGLPVSAGVYYCTLSTENTVKTYKLILLK